MSDDGPKFVIVGGPGAGDGAEASLGAPWWRLLLERFQREIAEWASERSWLVRVPVLVYFAYILVRHWGNLEYTSMIGGINLGVHEAGHILFRPLGEFMTIAGGTILEWIVPVAVGFFVFYLKQKDFFAVAFCFGWLSTALFDSATYCADARGQLNLILVSPWGQGFGIDGIGDWSRMLRSLGMLEWDTTISFALRLSATTSMLVCLAFGAWILWQIRQVNGASSA